MTTSLRNHQTKSKSNVKGFTWWLRRSLHIHHFLDELDAEKPNGCDFFFSFFGDIIVDCDGQVLGDSPSADVASAVLVQDVVTKHVGLGFQSGHRLEDVSELVTNLVADVGDGAGRVKLERVFVKLNFSWVLVFVGFWLNLIILLLHPCVAPHHL